MLFFTNNWFHFVWICLPYVLLLVMYSSLFWPWWPLMFFHSEKHSFEREQVFNLPPVLRAFLVCTPTLSLHSLLPIDNSFRKRFVTVRKEGFHIILLGTIVQYFQALGSFCVIGLYCLVAAVCSFVSEVSNVQQESHWFGLKVQTPPPPKAQHSITYHAREWN